VSGLARPDAGLGALARDLRHALRLMARAPAFNAGVIATTALAIGANAAIFSVAHAVLVREMPFGSPDRLFWVWSRQPAREKAPFNIPDFLDHRAGGDALVRLSAIAPWSAILGGGGEPERVQAVRASADLFETLGADVVLGRTLRPEDDAPGAARVVVLTHGLWVRRFAADPGVIGAKLLLDEEPHTVVGVLRPSFFLPLRDAELAVALRPESDPRHGIRSSVAFLRVVGRLRPGVSRARARAALGAIAARLQREHPDTNARKVGVTLVPIADEIVGGYRAALRALVAAVAGVLVIACANLANLTLARGSARATEIATRLALGATRPRLVRQLLTESLVLAAIGGVAGIGAAVAGVRLLVTFAPADLPRIQEIAVDHRVLLFTVSVTLAAGLAFGLLPALVTSRAGVGLVLKEAGRGGAEGPRSGGARRGLVAAEVAIAVVLSIVVGLFARSLGRLLAVRLGFEPAGAASARVALPPARYATPQAIAAYQRRVMAGLQSLPAVESAGAVTILPLSGTMTRVDFTVEGRAPAPERVPTAQYRVVTAGYLRVMGIPVLRGRGFTELDAVGTRPVVLVNEALARQFLADQEPIGARLLVDDNNGGPRGLEVVGVVGDVRQVSLDGEPTLDVYVPYAQLHPDVVPLATAMHWVVRGRLDAPAQQEAVRQALRGAEPAAPIPGLRSLEQATAPVLAPRRFNLAVLSVFAAVALLLSATGVYAMLSYSASRRARELAIRSALGAQRGDLVRLVLGQGLAPAAAGVAIGLGAALAIARTLSSMLFGVSAADPLTFIGVPLGLFGLALAASLLPALRASRTAQGGAAVRAS
jgi:putative ABC transport system permease protein